MKHLKRAAATPTKNAMNGRPFDESFFLEKRRGECYANLKKEASIDGRCELALVRARLACLEFCKSVLTRIGPGDLERSDWQSYMDWKFGRFNRAYNRDKLQIVRPLHRRFTELYASSSARYESDAPCAEPKWISQSQPATLANFGLLPSAKKCRGGARGRGRRS
jgi:hypothetical protein